MRVLCSILLCSILGLAPPTETRAVAPTRSCPQFEMSLIRHAPPGGWNVKWMSAAMWNESRCRPGAFNSSGARGLLQILGSWGHKLTLATGFPINARTLLDPTTNIVAAAALCTRYRQHRLSCYKPWASSTRPPISDHYMKEDTHESQARILGRSLSFRYCNYW